MDSIAIRDTLLRLSDAEKKERKETLRDFYFFQGECKFKGITDPTDYRLGQNWIVNEVLDYTPSQIIVNKTRSLLEKQAEYMFGKEPTVSLKSYVVEDKDKCEELRQFISWILEQNSFWSQTFEAFLMSTVKKRILLRVEANEGQPVQIFYHNIDDFAYTINLNNSRVIESITIAKPTVEAKLSQEKQIWNRYTYYVKENKCYLKTESYTTNNLEVPFAVADADTGLSKIPGFVIKNGNILGSEFGESDIADLKSLQNQYNRRCSDWDDELKFKIHEPTVITDATVDSVNKIRVAPNAVLPLVSLEDKTASIQRLGSTFNAASSVKEFLEMIEKEMHKICAVPLEADLKNVPSAKSIKYISNDLITKCEGKWRQWESVLTGLISLIIESCSKFNCYSDWKHEWDKLKFKTVITHNYPIPEDIEDKKRLALEEVNAGTMSKETYIEIFGDAEDATAEWKKILTEKQEEKEIESDQFPIAGDLNANQ